MLLLSQFQLLYFMYTLAFETNCHHSIEEVGSAVFFFSHLMSFLFHGSFPLDASVAGCHRPPSLSEMGEIWGIGNIPWGWTNYSLSLQPALQHTRTSVVEVQYVYIVVGTSSSLGVLDTAATFLWRLGGKSPNRFSSSLRTPPSPSSSSLSLVPMSYISRVSLVRNNVGVVTSGS